MLTDDEFNKYCERLKLSTRTAARIQEIRKSPPSRHVQGRRGNVTVRYSSRKMGCVIQAESHTVELAGILADEFDPRIFEYYDQPPRFLMHYLNKQDGGKISPWYTADLFELADDSYGYVEWKTEEELQAWAERQPNRIYRDPNGLWRCPPGEAHAAEFGAYFHVKSAAKIDLTWQRNLQWIGDYLIRSCPPPDERTVAAVEAIVTGQPGISLAELHRCKVATADDINYILAHGLIYFDPHLYAIAEPERMPLFRDQATAEAYASITAESAGRKMAASHTVSMAPGTLLMWDGKPLIIKHVGNTTVYLSTVHEPQTHVDLTRAQFDAYIQSGQLYGLPEDNASSSLHPDAHEILVHANDKLLKIADWRQQILRGELECRPDREKPPCERTKQNWRNKNKLARETYGSERLALVDMRFKMGRRVPRFIAAVYRLADQYIAEYYEDTKQPTRRAVYNRYKEASELNPPLPYLSYRSFCKRIANRDRHKTDEARKGKKGAYDTAEWYWELSTEVPRHGDRPWHIAHIDHTPLDLELVDPRTGKNLGKMWLTVMMDAYSRRILAIYLTFDEPSYRSCMMVIRKCVQRYNRLPDYIVVDGGREFRGNYFETLHAHYVVHKKARPWAQPHYGTVQERFFDTKKTEFISNLTGNTLITFKYRTVTKSVDPKGKAIWTPERLCFFAEEFCYEVYDKNEHTSLGQSPREAYDNGMALAGEREHLRIPYDEEFLLLSLPTTRKGTARVLPGGAGVKINYIHYWTPAFRKPGVVGTQVEVKYDPFDLGHAYAFVAGRWEECISQYHHIFRGRSEREIQLATATLRRQKQVGVKRASSLDGKRLAQFLTQVDAEEALLTQQRQDAASQSIRAGVSLAASKSLANLEVPAKTATTEPPDTDDDANSPEDKPTGPRPRRTLEEF